ncbi:MAG: hypothetical protein WC054_14620 [Candidatus Nanopelagicales bacterium]
MNADVSIPTNEGVTPAAPVAPANTRGDAAPSASAKTRRSAAVALGGAAILSTALAGCATEADYAQVCVDQQTQQRINETDCEPGSPRYGTTAGWFYIPRGGAVPGIGSSISSSSGSFAAPTSGSVNRGGFGSSRGGFSFGG